MKYRNSWVMFKSKILKSAVHKRLGKVLGLCCLCGFFFYLFHTVTESSAVTAQNFSDVANEQREYKEKTTDEENKKGAKKQEARKTVSREQRSKSSQKDNSEKININQASKETLMELPHIGAKKAEDIISYREAFGFTIIEDLMEVKGIGEKIFEKIASLITV